MLVKLWLEEVGLYNLLLGGGGCRVTPWMPRRWICGPQSCSLTWACAGRLGLLRGHSYDPFK